MTAETHALLARAVIALERIGTGMLRLAAAAEEPQRESPPDTSWARSEPIKPRLRFIARRDPSSPQEKQQ